MPASPGQAAQVTVREAQGADERAAALALRHTVFCDEQGVSLQLEQDGCDDEAIHIVALEDDGDLVGTCRLVLDPPTAKLGRLAVRKDRRGRGHGRRVLRRAEGAAREAGASRIALHAQTTALSLYRSEGYTAHGERFQEASIEHVAMEKRLA